MLIGLTLVVTAVITYFSPDCPGLLDHVRNSA
jgi:hypothetical protein